MSGEVFFLMLTEPSPTYIILATSRRGRHQSPPQMVPPFTLKPSPLRTCRRCFLVHPLNPAMSPFLARTEPKEPKMLKTLWKMLSTTLKTMIRGKTPEELLLVPHPKPDNSHGWSGFKFLHLLKKKDSIIINVQMFSIPTLLFSFISMYFPIFNGHAEVLLQGWGQFPT